MAKLDLLIGAWDEGHREFAIALEGLADEDLWRRPHPNLLSIGENAGHVTYYESERSGMHLPEGSPERISGPLVDPEFKYYTHQLSHPVVKGMGVAELVAEVARVHEEAKKMVLAIDPAFDEAIPGQKWWTWGTNIQYAVFHVSYHTGQVYSVRHLMGHTPTDN